jgi:hypothetical protein
MPRSPPWLLSDAAFSRRADAHVADLDVRQQARERRCSILEPIDLAR